MTYTGEVLSGQEEAFKQIVPKIVAAVEQEPGTMA
jgi:quinol monooxygenase YgiN